MCRNISRIGTLTARLRRNARRSGGGTGGTCVYLGHALLSIGEPVAGLI